MRMVFSGTCFVLYFVWPLDYRVNRFSLALILVALSEVKAGERSKRVSIIMGLALFLNVPGCCI